MKRILSLLLILIFTICSVSGQNLKSVKDKSTKKYGYQDKSKHWVINPAFDKAKAFNMGVAIVEVDGLQGLIDTNGDYLLEPSVTDIKNFDKDGLSVVSYKEKKKDKIFGVVNLDGEYVIPLECVSVDVENRRRIIHAERYFDLPQPNVYTTGYAAAWGVYDYDGEEILPPRYLSRLSFSSDGYAIAHDKISKKDGIVGLDGITYLPFEYFSIVNRADHYIALDKNFHWRIFREDFSRVGEEYTGFSQWAPGKSDIVSPVGTIAAAKGNSWGVIDPEGRVEKPFIYSERFSWVSGDVPPVNSRSQIAAEMLSDAHPWTLEPYSTDDDDLKAAAYGCNFIGVKMHRNSIRSMSYTGKPSNKFNVTLSELVSAASGSKVSWGRAEDRFVRLELELDDEHESSVPYPEMDASYTVVAKLYEADGTLVDVISRWGYLYGTVAEGIIYKAEDELDYFLAGDVNWPAMIRNATLMNFNEINNSHVYTAFSIPKANITKIQNFWSAMTLHHDVEVLEKTGYTSFEPRPVMSRQQQDFIDLLNSKYTFFRRKFTMNQVYTFKVPAAPQVGLSMAVMPAMAHYEDVYEPSTFHFVLEEPVYWGPEGDRYIKIEPEPFFVDPALYKDPAAVPGIVDDMYNTGYAIKFVFCLYESDGKYVRTVGEAGKIAFGEEDIVGFGDQNIVFTRIPVEYGTLKFDMVHPYTNKLSELKWIEI